METPSLRQAAIVLVGLGPQLGGEVLKHVPGALLERLAREIVGLGPVDPVERQRAFDELRRFREQASRFAAGGEAVARDMLERALGEHRAGKLMRHIMAHAHGTRFAAVQRSEPEVVAHLLRPESPQTAALVLAHLEPRRAAPILAALPREMQGEVAHRMANLDRSRPDVVNLVEDFLARELEGDADASDRRAGGPEQVAELLNQVDQESWAGILDEMREIDEDTASTVEHLMFVFEDIVTLEDRYVQDVLKEIDSRELTYALKGATNEVREKVFRNMSKRAGAGIQEDMEYLGPVQRSEVVDARRRIIDTIRRLERDGVIVLAGASRSTDVVD